jgi:preprotein translocase subunit SecD
MMKKNIKGRLILMAVTIVVAVVCFLPNTPIFDSMPGWWKNTFPDRGFVLGLDLQGGLHLVYEVDVEGALDKRTSRDAARLVEDLKEEDLSTEEAPVEVKVEGQTITVSPETREVRDYIEDQFRILERQAEGVYRLESGYARQYRKDAVDQALEKLRNRIDKYGVTEPTIVRQGETEIVIQLPGLSDPKEAMEYIGQTAQLEFKLLDEESTLPSQFPPLLEDAQVEEFLALISNSVPEGDEVLFERIEDAQTGKVLRRPYLVQKEVLMSGVYIEQASLQIDDRFNEYYVAMGFDRAGAKLFADITEKNVRKRLAIILDGNVYSAPTIQEKIAGGNASITGNFTSKEAKMLADVLEIGALPADLKVLQNVTVGPSLGRDSIAAGKLAGLIGGVLVIIFMIVYYRFSGVIADFALVMNIVLLMGAMAALNATLTLPGIAGIILAIGMAVDSNVLMFERMREELRAGKTPRAAVDSGYDKAFWTIFDSHVTTLITAMVLFQFGTGPIKGFAVTLSLGVAINLFTALVGTKTLFDLYNSSREVRSLSI